jgi:hypothetical protein
MSAIASKRLYSLAHFYPFFKPQNAIVRAYFTVIQFSLLQVSLVTTTDQDRCPAIATVALIVRRVVGLVPWLVALVPQH